MRILAVAIAGALVTRAPCVLAGAMAPLPPRLRGVPADGRVNVPTDVVPAFDVSALVHFDNESDFTLRSSSGDEVPISVTLPPHDDYISIQPGAALEPYTTMEWPVAGSKPQGFGDSAASCSLDRRETSPAAQFVLLALGACLAARRAGERGKRRP